MRTLHVISPRRTPSRRRLVKSMRSSGDPTGVGEPGFVRVVVPRVEDAIPIPSRGGFDLLFPCRVAVVFGNVATLSIDGMPSRVFFSPVPNYLLKVKGDSMRDEGIFDGDLIGVHRTRDARSGQIVVARVDDEITVKLLKISQERIRLLPRNPDFAPIDVQPGQDFAIEGLYCGLVRPNR